MSDVIRMKMQDVVNMGGGGGTDAIWLPSVNEAGDLSWTKSSTSTAPETVNIKGPAGQDGAPGQDGTDGADGVGIASIVKTSTSGKVDTYTITLTNGNTATFTVTNGMGVKSVDINGSSHLIVTYDDDTTHDAGAIAGGGGGATIDDTTPANNKVYSSSKTESLVGTKLDADLVTISGGGENLVDFDNCKSNWKPSTTVGDNYTEGSTVSGHYTTNLITYTTNEKLKFHIDVIPSYFKILEYGATDDYVGGTGSYTTDTDGNYYVTITNVNVKKVCFVVGYTTEANFDTLVVGRYDTFGNQKVVVNDLYLSDDNVDMAKTRLGISKDILFGKKWAVAGDSFTAGDFTGTTAPTIPSGQYAGKNAVYPYLIATRCNIDIQDLSKNGRTLALPSGEGSSYNSFINHYQSVAADADYLTIYFGINDSHQSIPIGTISDAVTSSFYGAWNTVLSWLIENRPNLHIGIIVSNGCDSDDYRTATIAIAQKYGLPYIDMNGDKQTPCMLRSTNASIDSAVRNQRTDNWKISNDNGHPNADCHAFEATFIENFLRSL